jgi:CheY-like chemotaxis protein
VTSAEDRPCRTRQQPRGGIAVVDDEPALCEVLTEVLTAEGYPTRAFPSAQACLEAIAAGYRPGLLFVDLHMRGLGGAEFVRRVRALPWGATVPIYIVSGALLEQDSPVLRTVDGVIAKPFRLGDILAAAARHLGEPASQARPTATPA